MNCSFPLAVFGAAGSWSTPRLPVTTPPPPKKSPLQLHEGASKARLSSPAGRMKHSPHINSEVYTHVHTRACTRPEQATGAGQKGRKPCPWGTEVGCTTGAALRHCGSARIRFKHWPWGGYWIPLWWWCTFDEPDRGENITREAKKAHSDSWAAAGEKLDTAG